ncbi:TonB-dependent receptor [Marinibactrum halimedae]|uniref:Oar protein n=1 Tax=Marinibactrum halimedae TaxID=1444977 RepID=A0AA37TB87_9GAMM|nr:TonB-dependent receptor [Marinibactrum halimedae]MCD9460481.1 TonB-dependent receptor [Marinibactrum halimedae]GLS25887.1 Oar protein [Marinibactrum halimedae]
MSVFTRNRLAAATLMALCAGGVHAQQTSSSINGAITTPDGTPATNTTIVVLHVPSNTIKQFVTNNEGRFSASGLRVGGPYRITIDSPVYKDKTLDEVYLQLDKPFNLDMSLSNESIEELTVVANASAFERNSGTDSLFNAVTVEVSPSMDRDLKDVIRNNPFAVVSSGDDNELSIAGTNPNYNSLTVDGINQNDEFGLNGSGYPTLRSPISTQAIEAVSVSLSPFNARSSGFSGGQINAVTKSGSNEFHGSMFYEERQSKWGGSAENPLTGRDAEIDYERTNWGATFSGPILEDELFFFLSYEYFKEPSTQSWGPAGSGTSNETYLSEAQYDQIRQIGMDVYGVDVGDWRLSPEEEDEKILVKLDYNINDDHRASFTYQYTNGNRTSFGGSRQSRLLGGSGAFDLSNEMTSYAFQLYSYWSDSFSTELSLSYKDVVNGQDSFSSLPGIIITADSDSECNNSRGCETRVSLGSDANRHAARLDNQRINFEWVGELLVNEHTLSFGTKIEDLDVFNLFVPNSRGTYQFNSIEDFENRQGYIEYSNAYTNDAEDAATDIQMRTTSLFIQDDWFITPNLELNLGLRYELTSSSSQPQLNEQFAERYGFSNTENLDGVDLFLPRIGFQWTASDTITLSGGLGRYSGGRPNVWLGDAWVRDGVTLAREENYGSEENTRTISSFDSLPSEILYTDDDRGDGNVTAIDPNFKMPSDWRASISLDAQLPYDWNFNATYVRVEQENDVYWVDLARERNIEQAGEVTTTVDGGRIIYPVNSDDPERFDLLMTNADKSGHSNLYSLSLNKFWDTGWNVGMSYAHQDIVQGNPAAGNNAFSNYQRNPSVNRNEVRLGRSDFEIEHRFILNVGYDATLFADYRSTFSLFFERRSGNPFSWVLADQSTFRNGPVGDPGPLRNVFSNAYLPYIPTGESDNAVAFGENGSLTYSEVMEEVSQAGLEGSAGSYVEKNSDSTPWISQLDFKFTQEIPGFSENYKGIVEVTLRNVFDFLDDKGIYTNDHGQVRRMSFPSRALFRYDINENGQYRYYQPPSFNGASNWNQFDEEASSWGLKLGVRFEF